MANLTRKKIVVAICLLISSFLLVVFRQYSFFEIVISWVGIVIITVPPHLLLSRYFTEYSLSSSETDISISNNRNKAKVLYFLLILVFGFIFWLMLILYRYMLG